jgi:putative NADPH-quinone reductase
MVVRVLTAAGHSVEVSDLYAESFNPGRQFKGSKR